LEKLTKYRSKWTQVDRMQRDSFPELFRNHKPRGSGNRGRLLKRQLKGWGQNGSSDPLPSLLDDDDGGGGGGDAHPTYTATEWRILLLHLFTVNQISRNSAWRHAAFYGGKA
jgi:hypothetical protein